MNSMIRQHHLRIPDVKAYLRTFDRHRPLSPDEWAGKESSLYEPGYLIFCLEPVAAPAGLSSFSKRGEDQGETFRVKDFCVVISKEDGKLMAVVVSPSAYEHRILDSLLLEKAMKAILDGRDFNYLAARPTQRLDGDAIKALVKLGAEYAKGGSRRTLAVEGATLQEPATALLSKLGAKIPTQIGKQLLDIGSICHMIFTPDGRQEDKSKSVLKSCFVPVRADEELDQQTGPRSSDEGQPLYTIDPMADVARAQENYASEGGNIDLSSLAPQPSQQGNYEAALAPALENQGEPSSSFGDFGMGLVSALAPQNSGQPGQPAPDLQPSSLENPAESSRSAELPSLPFGGNLLAGELAANASDPPAARSAMEALPPTGPSVSFTGLASMPSQPPPPSAGSSMTGMPSVTGFPPGAGASSSMSGMPAVSRAGGNGQGEGVADWFIMSHEAIPAASADASLAMETPASPPPPKEDFSQQFLSDWQQGNAGPASFEAAEKEFERERRIKSEGQRGKEQRLRDYFGEEHFQKYVQGEISEPDMDKVDAWELAREYHSEPTTEEGPNFDSDIFANAGRSTLETNPGAVVLETEADEITGPPPDPSWAIPANMEPVKGRRSDRSFDNMLAAVSETPPSDSAQTAEPAENQGYTPGAVPNLSILDALQAQPPSAVSPPAPAQELGPLAVPADSQAEANSLFERLTGELSKDLPGAAAAEGQSTTAEEPSQAVDQAQPTTLNWAPPPSTFGEESASVTNSGVWPDVTPRESLFATADDNAAEVSKEASTQTSSSDRWAQPATSQPFESTAMNQSEAATTSSATQKATEEPLADIPWPGAAEATVAQSESALSSWGTEVEPASRSAASDSHSDLAPVAASGEAAGQAVEAEATGAEAAVEPAAAADMQQPRVRPRDYSSPLRGSRSATGGDLLSPMTPHPTVTRNNLPAQLPSGSLTQPPAAASTPTPFSVPRSTSSPVSKSYTPPVVPPPPPLPPAAASSQAIPEADLPPAPDLSIEAVALTAAPSPDLAPATAAPDLTAAASADMAPAPAADMSETKSAALTASQDLSTAASAATAAEAATPPVVSPDAAVPSVPSPATSVSSATSFEKAPTPLPFRPRPASLPSSSASSDSLPSLSSLSASQASASGDNQDARLMMNEMTSLMSKLEMQVAKAANKMASRAEELRGRLSQQVDDLVNEAQNVEKQAESNLFTLASELKAKLEALAVEVETSLASDAKNAQLSVEEIAQNGLDRLESDQMQLALDITRCGEDFRKQLDKLASTVSARLDNLMEDRNEELISLSDSINAQLKESHDMYHIKVAQRYDRFEVRMNEETASISQSLDRNMRSMVEEIETSLERACEKLKNTKFELEQTVAHIIAVSEMAIAQKAKHLLAVTLLPRLNEQKEIIRTMISDMSKQISKESSTSLDAEVAKLDQGAILASNKLRKLAAESVAEVELTGRSIKTGLEDHFKRASSDLQARTREVGDKIKETERRMADSEYASKGLAEASTVDSEPELAEERNRAVSKLASLKSEASKQFASSIEQSLDGLDAKSDHLISELSNKRSDLTSQVREAAESKLTTVRQALQEATSAIQAACGKHME